MRMPSFWHLKTCPEATQTERVGMKALSSIEHMILVDIDPLKNTNSLPKNTVIQITSWTILTHKDLSYSQKRTFHINLMIMASIAHFQSLRSICKRSHQKYNQAQKLIMVYENAPTLYLDTWSWRNQGCHEKDRSSTKLLTRGSLERRMNKKYC